MKNDFLLDLNKYHHQCLTLLLFTHPSRPQTLQIKIISII